MASFSLDFPDDEILDILGDDIKVFHSGGSTDIKGEFEHKYMDNELGDRVGIQYPVVIVSDVDAGLFKKKNKVEFNGDTYIVINSTPHEVGKTLIILRS